MLHTVRRGDWMQTYTGRTFYPLAPRPEDIDVADIAHALSQICRFGAHTRRWYSVAEHAVLVSHAVPAADALSGLLHDGGEAYVGDMVRPLKYALPDYIAVEHNIQAAIAERFGLPTACPPSVKDADLRILRDERDALMLPPAKPWVLLEQVEPLGVTINGWPPALAEAHFHRRFAALTGGPGDFMTCVGCGDDIWPGETVEQTSTGVLCLVCIARMAVER